MADLIRGRCPCGCNKWVRGLPETFGLPTHNFTLPSTTTGSANTWLCGKMDKMAGTLPGTQPEEAVTGLPWDS